MECPECSRRSGWYMSGAFAGDEMLYTLVYRHQLENIPTTLFNSGARFEHCVHTFGT